MKLLVWLAVMCTAFRMSQTQCTGAVNGDIRVIGEYTTSFVAGHMEICVLNRWRSVCDDGWDSSDATVACRQLGFSEEVQAIPCTNSSATTSSGIGNFNCGGHEIKLSPCGFNSVSGSCQSAGIICSTMMSPEYTCPTSPAPQLTTCSTCPECLTSQEPQLTTCPTCPECPTSQEPQLATCPECPTSQEPQLATCPECPTSQPISTCPTCPECPTSHAQEPQLTTCPECSTSQPTTCPSCPECPTSQPTTCPTCPVRTCPASPPCPTSPPITPTETTTSAGIQGDARADLMRESCPSLAPLGAGLGVLCAILAILLVGVVIGWVWSGRRRAGTPMESGLQEKALSAHVENILAIEMDKPEAPAMEMKDKPEAPAVETKDGKHTAPEETPAMDMKTLVTSEPW